ncbi:MAG: cobalamin-dependent protein, partial [Myxococcota bacterium]
MRIAGGMQLEATPIYKPKHPIRLVTAASLFDGHDAAINIMRRIIQSSGGEVIHLGHDRSVQDVVDCAIQEDANAIAMTSYQGGHLEYFKYMFDLLKNAGCEHIKIFGGGGGVILPSEIDELHAYGIERIYSPDDGRSMGLQGMINDLLERSDFATGQSISDEEIKAAGERQPRALARLISAFENYPEQSDALSGRVSSLLSGGSVPVLGITGTGGAGKSSLVDELVRR